MKHLCKRKVIAIVLSVAMVLQMSIPAFATEGLISLETSSTQTPCTHHTHNEECSYREGMDCTHDHTEDCYIEVADCTHDHTEDCYTSSDLIDQEDNLLDNEDNMTLENEEDVALENVEATPSILVEPTLSCIHESGDDCINIILACNHAHDDICGYSSHTPCNFDATACLVCNPISNEDIDCICEVCCTPADTATETVAIINSDCLVCNSESSDLTECTGVALLQNIALEASVFRGSGTSEDPYEISTAADLAQLAELVNTITDTEKYNTAFTYYQLQEDIDLIGYANWVPIGKYNENFDNSRYFKGTFDGNGYVIKNLTITGHSTDNDIDLDKFRGLFGANDVTSVIKNLGIVDCSITGTLAIGGVIGHAYGTITNCYVTGKIAGKDCVGGIAGTSSFQISNCYSTATVTGIERIGGIVGHLKHPDSTSALVTNCYSTGTITVISSEATSPYAGGIVGLSSNSTISNCVSINPLITSSNNSINAARICPAKMGTANIINSYGFVGTCIGLEGQETPVSSNDSQHLHGANLFRQALNSGAAFWQDTVAFDPSIWTIESGKLPILKNMKGAQSGAISEENKIDNPPVTKDDLTYTASADYTGSSQEVTITVKDNKIIGAVTVYYNESTSEPVNVGTYKISVDVAEAATNTSFTAVTDLVLGDYVINPKMIQPMVTLPKDTYSYTGLPHTPSPSVTYNGKELLLNVDYTLAYSNNLNIGTASITLSPKDGSNFTFIPFVQTFKIVPVPIGDLDLSAKFTSPAKNGVPVTSFTNNQYTANITWSPAVDDKFVENIIYTATVSVTPTEHYTLAGVGENSFKYNGATNVSNAANSNVITVVFPKTADKILKNIVITNPPTKTIYELFETFDTTGMVIKATYEDGTTNHNFLNYTVINGSSLTGKNASVTIQATENVGITAIQPITVNKIDQHPDFGGAEIFGEIKEKGDKNFTITANGANTAVTYSSNNPAVAIVDSTTGEVTLIGAGTAAITAIAEESDLYNRASVTYSLKVISGTVEIGNNETISFDGCIENLELLQLNNNTLTVSTNGYLSGYPGYEFNNGVIGKLEKGSIKVTLYKEFLATLPANGHILSIRLHTDEFDKFTFFIIPEKVTNLSTSINGGGDGTSGIGTNYTTGDTVTIDAGTMSGLIFNGWTVTAGNVTLANETSATTSFIMLDENVVLTANWIPSSSNGSSSNGSSYNSTYYSIAATAGEGGAISTDKTLPVRKGDSATFTFTPNKGYQVADVIVNGKSIGAVETFTFTNVRSNQRIHVTFKLEGYENTQTGVDFTDVKETHWFYDAVMTAVEKGWFVGTSETTFSPNSTMTRGMIVTVLHRLAESPEVETTDTQWYAQARVWAMKNGISDGTNMDGNVTREQMAAILYRFAGLMGVDTAARTSLDGFADGDMTSDYAVEAMEWSVASGLFAGKGNNNLDPKSSATRAEVAALLERFDALFTKEEDSSEE